MANDIRQVNGPITVYIKENETALKVFSQKERNTVVRAAMTRAANFWCEVFLPMRFTDYARKLRYRVTREWDLRKVLMLATGTHRKDGRKPIAPQPTPLVFDGTMRKAVLGGYSVQVTATQTRPVARIKMPTGHAIKGNTAYPLKTVPPWEAQRLMEVLKKAFVAALGRAGARADFKKQAKIAGQAAKAEARAASRHARAAARAARKAENPKQGRRPKLTEAERATRKSVRAFRRRHDKFYKQLEDRE